ncbi:MAG: ABC transporter permease [Thermoanaerobacterales bacterium]|nr:ABC transporter permease [Thermoanaerobacterales bacterium]
MDASWGIDFIYATIRAATPLIYCALGVLLAERAGVMHLGVEGVMLTGALAGIIATNMSGTIFMGILMTLLTGLLLGLLLSIASIWLPTDQVIVGIAFNLAATGVTSYIYRLLGSTAQNMVAGIKPVFLGMTIFEIFSVILTVAIWWFLFKTAAGLKLRSVGEDANAANTAGIDVIKVRTITLIVAAILSALGGAALSLGWVRVFTDNITGGRGFIALAAVYLSKWNPLLVIVSTLIFGAGEALAFRSQALGGAINSYYYFMLPYVLTLIVVGITGKTRGPADVGRVFIRR